MIYGDRIRLRAAEKSDIELFVTWLNDPDVRQYLLLHLPMSIAQEDKWFENNLSMPFAEQVMVIEAKDGDSWKPIGNTSFMGIEWTHRLAEVGIFIGEKEYWNRGYGRETMKLMLKHGFNTLNFNRIWLRVNEQNARGIKAYEYAGFQCEGRLRQAVYQDGRYHDMVIMSVLREDWIQ